MPKNRFSTWFGSQNRKSSDKGDVMLKDQSQPSGVARQTLVEKCFTHKVSQAVQLHQAFKSFLELRQDILDLKSSYKVERSTNNSYFSLFTSSSRPRSVDFITTIAQSLPNSLSDEGTIFDVETYQNILLAACFYEHKKIEQSYDDAYYSKDPRSSGMFRTLNKILLKMAPEAKPNALSSLKVYLVQEGVAQKIKFPEEGSEGVAATLNTLIDESLPPSESAPDKLAPPQPVSP
jgi:hypothetical protein